MIVLTHSLKVVDTKQQWDPDQDNGDAAMKDSCFLAKLGSKPCCQGEFGKNTHNATAIGEEKVVFFFTFSMYFAKKCLIKIGFILRL